MSNCATRVIEKLGGHKKVANILGVNVSQVYRWTYPRTRGGTDGLIPSRHQSDLLAASVKEGLGLSPADFFDTHECKSGEAA